MTACTVDLKNSFSSFTIAAQTQHNIGVGIGMLPHRNYHHDAKGDRDDH
jgi:hypothetical protein